MHPRCLSILHQNSNSMLMYKKQSDNAVMAVVYIIYVDNNVDFMNSGLTQKKGMEFREGTVHLLVNVKEWSTCGSQGFYKQVFAPRKYDFFQKKFLNLLVMENMESFLLTILIALLSTEHIVCFFYR